ncbi:MAG: hypothetical protein PWQ29_755 [Verrucomicrobiota bacterium]|jgi:hypothetical protein|nr:hypothetical protein [Verrucomicrobiota bacterium]
MTVQFEERTPPDKSAHADSVNIYPVQDRRTQRLFLNLPASLYASDSVWIPPLQLECRHQLSPRNPYFRHASFRAWIACRDGNPVGRISAQVDRLHIERYNDRTGFFGLLEARDDPEVFQALFDTAEKWLRDQGMRSVRGPFNLSINEECGLLVAGFDTPPMIMMGHALPYYPQRIEEQGYSGVQNLLAYRIRSDFAAPRYLDKMISRFGSRVRLRSLHLPAFDKDLAIIKEIYEDAWSGNWGFIPFTTEEFAELGKNLKLLVPSEFVCIAEVDGEPAAMMVVFPNLNEAIRDLNGRLLPLGWLKLLWRLKVTGVKTGRVPLMGVRRRFQDSQLGAALALMMITSLQPSVIKYGMQEAEMSWILESNKGMRNIIKMLGGEPYKRYRIYQKNIP